MTDNVGFLKIAVSTADGALPVQGAKVMVSGEDGHSLTLFTDESGLTESISLSAPPASTSQSAGGGNPFTSYRVTVEKEGFYPHTTGWVPIFSGISARQPINLIGLAEYGADTLIPSDADTVMRDPQALNQRR